MNIYREVQTEESCFTIPIYNLSLSICIQNMKFLWYTVVEISLTKKYGEKEKRIQGDTNRQRLILIPTIQLAIVKMYTKYKVSTLNGFRDIFDETLQY